MKPLNCVSKCNAEMRRGEDKLGNTALCTSAGAAMHLGPFWQPRQPPACSGRSHCRAEAVQADTPAEACLGSCACARSLLPSTGDRHTGILSPQPSSAGETEAVQQAGVKAAAARRWLEAAFQHANARDAGNASAGISRHAYVRLGS